MSLRKAIVWSAVWIILSLCVNVFIYYTQGEQKAIEFFTGYLIEKSLSVDNLFVFLTIFNLFNVKPKYQRRVLNYGIVGVLLLRGILILLGITLIQEFHWIMYIFGALLIYTSYHIIVDKKKTIEPEKKLVIRWFKKIMPVAHTYEGEKFFIRENGVLAMTPLFIVLLIIETTDIIFAVDSIPAIFAITVDPFIIVSSNVMAVLGLRSMYFVLVKVHNSFIYVKYGVAIILVYVGIKMLIIDFYKIDTSVSLGVVFSILITSVFFSIIIKKRIHE